MEYSKVIIDNDYEKVFNLENIGVSGEIIIYNSNISFLSSKIYIDNITIDSFLLENDTYFLKNDLDEKLILTEDQVNIIKDIILNSEIY